MNFSNDSILQHLLVGYNWQKDLLLNITSTSIQVWSLWLQVARLCFNYNCNCKREVNMAPIEHQRTSEAFFLKSMTQQSSSYFDGNCRQWSIYFLGVCESAIVFSFNIPPGLQEGVYKYFPGFSGAGEVFKYISQAPGKPEKYLKTPFRRRYANKNLK